MSTILKKHFPMLKDRQTIIREIKSNSDLLNTYDGWSRDEQEKFLDYCTGERGLKITYDPYFKEIFNYNYNPERLNNLLSCIIGQKVEILEVLPNEGARIASEKTLLITDMLVRLEDQSLVNIEIQKIGYLFPGERASCYSADLLLREYKRVRDERKRHFKYGDIKPVYTIVIFEDSPSNLKEAKDFYIHKSNTVFDTGVKINLLQKFIFISLDNFKDILHNRVEAIKQNSIALATHTNDKSNNKAIKLFENKLEEWLTFLSIDEPEYIAMLINHNPYFKAIYSDIYEMCLNTERLMQMYSKELAELDHNTVIYMIDEIKAEADRAKEEANMAKEEANMAKEEANMAKEENDRLKAEIEELKKQLEENKSID